MDAHAPQHPPRHPSSAEGAAPAPKERELAAVLPALTPVDRATLRESIRLEGLLIPIVRSAGPAFAGEIADGFARAEICHELGIECPAELRAFASEHDFRHFRITTNLCRRQLTDAQRIRLGMLLEPAERERAAKRRAQAKGKPRGEKSLPVDRPEESGEAAARAAALVGLKPAKYRRGSAVLREGPPALVAAFDAGEETVGGAYRKLQGARKRAERDRIAERLENEALLLPTGAYRVLVVDPPWPYEDLPYPPMTLEQIAALPVLELLAEDAIVWLWTTNRFMYESQRIAREAWGLEERNILTWVKNRPGQGYWLQGQSEHCLLLTRGNPVHRLQGRSTILRADVREHSRKPDEFYDLVRATCPGSKAELFARERREGFTCCGIEADKFGLSAEEGERG